MAAKKSLRNPELIRGVGKFSRSKMYHKKGLWAIKKKNGGKFPQHQKKPISIPPTEKPPKFYPADDVKKPLVNKHKPKPTKLRASITPGTVLIILAGRFKGKRVVFLKQLLSGLLLVTGPFKLNGVPLRRVNQAYVIATSTNIDVSGVNVEKIDDKYFAKEAEKKKKKGEGEFFEEKKEEKNVLPQEKKDDQKAVDASLIKAIEAVPDLKDYLSARFSLKSAYCAVMSLLQTLDQQNTQLLHIYPAGTLDSLRATAEYFQHFLENISKSSSSRIEPGRIKSLEEKIRDAANEVEDVVELKLLREQLLEAVDKMDTTRNQVRELVFDVDDQVLELSGDSLIGTSSTSDPLLEDDIVHGLDDDLEIIVDTLKGSSRDLEIVTISDISSTVMMLPNLEELKLKYFRTDRQEWRLGDEDKFENLKFFVLDFVDLKLWEASSDNFPNLKRLVLKSCRDLQEIPTDFGEIFTLESIELRGCSTTAEDSARNIAQQQEDMGNDILKVFIHKSRGRLNLSQKTLC